MVEKDKNNQKKTGSSATGKVVGALVAGAAVGVAVGILTAPKKGSKTRAKILDDAKDLASTLKTKAAEFKEKGNKE
ncbi:YtxH domain-containing protein [Fluviicola taffensis]|uniref:YtxH-like protein n=1 Tax=Fluviicola taffensis (strain DSM 16823 / NCIMB 13979 / RW262) TaxID=755732 RepID=F2IJZ7_FLUTR|nr:YtxH domain-containing protein [Fluviicola taffensis]AEA45056.1 hypothetical protein Fluta_3080 [Fluviicola taffensis DSM 16823]